MVVLSPAGPEGPRRFALAGASRVLVVGGDCPAEPGLEVLPGPVTPGRLPLRDRSVDALTCLEGFAGLAAEPRRSLVAEARRVLRRGGVFAVCAAANDGDLWRAEDELRQHFPHVVVFAQLAWQGISLAPLLDAEPTEPPTSALRGDLLRSPLPARGYLLVASPDAFDDPPECVVVPTGALEDVPKPQEIAEEIPAAPPAPAFPDIEDLFAEVATPPVVAPVLTPPSPSVGPSAELLAELERLRSQSAEFDQERQKFLAYSARLAAELERSREEKARTEAELHAARLRIESLQRAPEDSRMHSLAALMQAVAMPGAQPAVAAHELVEEVAPLVAPESGRATTDAALDRNRLREELARRTAELQALETRVLQQEEELRREHLENVRLVTDVDRMREQVERSRAIEQERVQELERLGHELRKLEVLHAELQGQHTAQEQRLREREAGGGEPSEQAGAEREQLKARERATAEVVRRRDRELAEATRTVRELRRSVEDHASVAAELRGELAVMQVHVPRLEETVPTLQERLREQQRKTLDHEEEAATLQRRLEEAVAEQEHLRGRLRRQRQEVDSLAGAKQGAEVELFRLRRELEAKHQAIEQLQQIVALGTGHIERVAAGPLSEDARAEVFRLHSSMAEQAAEHAQALERSEAEHQRIVEAERARLRRARLEAAIRAEEMEYMLFQLDTAEQRIWEMNDATDRSAARLAAGLAQLEKQKEQYEDLVDELEVTRNLLVEAQAKIAELERHLDSERTRIARISILGPTPTSDPEVFDVSVDEPDPEAEDLAPNIRRLPDENDHLAGINFDDDSEQESLAVRLAGRIAESSETELPVIHDPSASGPAFALPSDDLDLDDEDFAPPPPPRVVVVPDEDEDEEVFAIDTDGWIEEDAVEELPVKPAPAPPRPAAQTSPPRDREHSNARIVIEILENEAWPDDDPEREPGGGAH